MSLLSGWWLAAGALAAGLVILLHRLRPRPKRTPVSSLLLWRLVEARLSKESRRRRVLSDLILALQVAALAAIALALARPSLSGDTRPLQIALVVDTSASMAVSDAGAVRFEKARAALLHFLEQGEATRYTYVKTTGLPLVYDGGDKSALIEALRTSPVLGGENDWAGVVDELRSHLDPRLPAVVVVATDGAFSPQAFDAFHSLPAVAGIYSIDVGAPQPNVGIAAFAARELGEEGRHQVLVRVVNASPVRREVPLSVRELAPPGDGAEPRLLYEANVEVEARSSREILFNHSVVAAGALHARVEVSDPFPIDDDAFLVFGEPLETRILYVGTANTLVGQGFAAFPHVRLDATLLPFPTREQAAAYDLIVFYDRPVPDDFEGTALALVGHGAAGGSGTGTASGAGSGEVSGVDAGAGTAGAQVTWWNRTHPLSRFVDWTSVAPGPVEPLSVKPGERVLVESDRGPIVTAEESSLRRVVRVAIPMEESDLPFRVAYPVFLQNVIEWVQPGGRGWVRETTPPGSPSRIASAAALRAAEERLVIQDWNGAAPIELPAGYSGDLVAGLVPGVYTWHLGDSKGTFAVSLLQDDESDISPRERTDLGGLYGIPPLEGRRLADVVAGRPFEEPGPVGGPQGAEGIIRALGLLALLLILAESWFYVQKYRVGHARTTGLLHASPALRGRTRGEGGAAR